MYDANGLFTQNNRTSGFPWIDTALAKDSHGG